MIIPILITIYLICGAIFEVLSEDSQPDVIKNNRILRLITMIVVFFLWFPWLLINMCFTKRDIWFKKKNYENN